MKARKVSPTYRKAIMVDDHGDGIWRTVEVYRRGTPAGPDPDRAEMLLAEGLANAATRSHADYERHGFIHWVAAWVKGAPLVIQAVTTDERLAGEWIRDDNSDELAAMQGASSVVKRHASYAPFDTDHENPDAYAAGAALALALEEP